MGKYGVLRMAKVEASEIVDYGTACTLQPQNLDQGELETSSLIFANFGDTPLTYTGFATLTNAPVTH